MIIPPSQPVFHVVYARLLCLMLAQRGIASDTLLGPCGLTAADLDGDANIDATHASALVQQALRQTGQADLSLDFGARAHLFAHGAVGLAVSTAPNVEAAVRTLAEFAQLRAPAIQVELQELPELSESPKLTGAPGFAALDFVVHDQFGPAPLRQFVFNAFAVLTEHLFAPWVGGAITQMQYFFPGAAPAYVDRYRSVLQGDAHFDAPALSLRFPRVVLQVVNPQSDPQAYLHAVSLCRQSQAQRDPHAALLARVRRAINYQRANGLSVLASSVAARLATSERSLFRQLHAAGWQYQNLVDAQRTAEAQSLLRTSADSIERIAERLGFSDASNFARNFRRCCGVSPNQYRKNCLAIPHSQLLGLKRPHALEP